MPEAESGPVSVPTASSRAHTEGSEDPRQFSSPKRLLSSSCPGKVRGGRRAQKELRSGSRGPGREFQCVLDWQCDCRQGPLGPISLTHKGKTSVYKCSKGGSSCSEIYDPNSCEKSVQERNTRVSGGLFTLRKFL